MDALTEALMFIVVLAPLISFATIWCVPSSRPQVIGWLSTAFVATSFLAACRLMMDLWNQEPVTFAQPWFIAGEHALTLNFSLDHRSVVMLVVVSFISLMVHMYSTAYMRDDRGYKKYFAFLGLFTFSMQGIVVSDNLLLLFVFWELVGFASYILIGHWTDKQRTGPAATKAFIFNRVGDVGFLIGLMILWTLHGTLALPEILATPPDAVWGTAAALAVFCGVVGKSAQFPLFTWLPDAMEGPTPVSAFIHAATMVAAGVYLLIKTFGLFTETALVVVSIVGMITAITGALAALSQYDLKKILAYSTMSQLGLMVLAVGMGIVNAAFLHLITHAFFKACLFLSAGIVIYSLNRTRPTGIAFDPQDIRHMGGLKSRMPIAFVTFILSGASLAGIPFSSGFLSKEAILVSLLAHGNMLAWIMIAVVLSVSFLTVLYTFRMISLVFLGEQRTVQSIELREPATVMRLTAMILAGCSLWLIVSFNPFNFKGWMLAGDPDFQYGLWTTLFSIAWVAAALFVALRVSHDQPWRISPILKEAFYVDRIYAWGTDLFLQLNSRTSVYIERKLIDKTLHGLVYLQVIIAHVVGWTDRFIVDGAVNSTVRITGWMGRATRAIQGGNVQLYIFWAALTTIIFIIWALH